MGPNGAGKSTLGYVLAGRAGYEATGGRVTLDGTDLLALDAHERAAAGLFLGLQYPVEIPGVSNLTFLRTALNAQRRARGEAEASGAEFMKLVKAQAEGFGLSLDMLKRPVNVGFSGGEKKRNEMVQMAVLGPKLAVLDETDSGLDIDALRVVADGINRLRSPTTATLLITHYQRLLDYVVPDRGPCPRRRADRPQRRARAGARTGDAAATRWIRRHDRAPDPQGRGVALQRPRRGRPRVARRHRGGIPSPPARR